MPEGCKRKHKHKTDRNDGDNAGLENGIQPGDRNTEEDSNWNENVVENPSTSTRKP